MNINHNNQMKPIKFKKAYERGMDKEEKEIRQWQHRFKKEGDIEDQQHQQHPLKQWRLRLTQLNEVFFKNKLLMGCANYQEAKSIIVKHKMNLAKKKLEIKRENNYSCYYDKLGE